MSRFHKIVLTLTTLLTLMPASAGALAWHIPAALPNRVLATTAIANSAECKHSFLGLEPWFAYIPDTEFAGGSGVGKCDIKCFNITTSDATDRTNRGCEPTNTKSDIPLVLLAVIDDLLRIAGMVALAFVLYGAFQYVIGQGNPESTSKAQGTIVNALIGMTLAIVSVLIVSYIGHVLG